MQRVPPQWYGSGHSAKEASFAMAMMALVSSLHRDCGSKISAGYGRGKRCAKGYDEICSLLRHAFAKTEEEQSFFTTKTYDPHSKHTR